MTCVATPPSFPRKQTHPCPPSRPTVSACIPSAQGARFFSAHLTLNPLAENARVPASAVSSSAPPWMRPSYKPDGTVNFHFELSKIGGKKHKHPSVFTRLAGTCYAHREFPSLRREVGPIHRERYYNSLLMQHGPNILRHYCCCTYDRFRPDFEHASSV